VTTATVADRFAGGIERCRDCSTIMPEKGARACPKCGRERVTPRHENWPRHLKRWLIAEMVRRAFSVFPNKQHPWERMLEMAFSMQTRNGKSFKMAVRSDEVYALGVEEAGKWLADGQRMDFME
jgi:hypothetical protein